MVLKVTCLYHLAEEIVSGSEGFLSYMFQGKVETPTFGSCATPDWLSMLWREGHNNFTAIDATLSNIAKSMTNQIRLAANPEYAKHAIGAVWWSSTCVEVQWAWLSLHALLVVLCIIFLLLTMLVNSRHARGRLWMSSPLALMYHGLDGPTAEKVGVIDAVDNMEERARMLRVHLAHTDCGWKLVEYPS